MAYQMLMFSDYREEAKPEVEADEGEAEEDPTAKGKRKKRVPKGKNIVEPRIDYDNVDHVG